MCRRVRLILLTGWITNSKAQEESEKAAKAEKLINALDLTKLETAVNNLEKSETAMKEFKKQLSDFENSLKTVIRHSKISSIRVIS